MIRTGWLVAATLGAALWPGPSLSVQSRPEGRRVALIIGIDSYVHLKGLTEATRDAWAITAVLKEKAKFSVVTTIADPASAAELRAGIDAFIAAIQPNDAVVVYYAGHGIQSKGRNFLVPPDLPANEATLEKAGIPVDALLTGVQKRSAALTILMLDACRNNPLGGEAGLARMEPGPNTWIEFAAEAGKTAADGAFMRHLLAELPKPGLPLNEVFQNVRSRLKQQSGAAAQNTLSINNLEINFFFVPGERVSGDDALATLKRIADELPRGDMGQRRAVESLIQAGHSLSGTTLLQGLLLAKAALDGGQLSRARMKGTDLSEATLRKADLSAADLQLAVLTGVDASGASLEGASISFGDAAANFTGVRAADSGWFGVRAERAVFTNAQLQRAGFMFANLRGANFNGAHLENAFFIGSDLTGATFDGATLENTDFAGAIVDGVTLTPTQLKNACESDEAGSVTESFGVVVMEVIPNSRFDGGLEYSRFLDQRYAYLLPSNGLPTCRKRELKDRVWYPVWHSARGEHVRRDVALQVTQKFLEQAGRRAAVRNRVDEHFAWLIKTQRGR